MTRDQLERLHSLHGKLLLLASELERIASDLKANGFPQHADTLSGLRNGLLDEAPIVRRLTDVSRN